MALLKFFGEMGSKDNSKQIQTDTKPFCDGRRYEATMIQKDWQGTRTTLTHKHTQRRLLHNVNLWGIFNLNSYRTAIRLTTFIAWAKKMGYFWHSGVKLWTRANISYWEGARSASKYKSNAIKHIPDIRRERTCSLIKNAQGQKQMDDEYKHCMSTTSVISHHKFMTYFPTV